MRLQWQQQQDLLPTWQQKFLESGIFKAEDAQYFAKSLKEVDETELSVDEMKERKIMRLLLKIKKGTPAHLSVKLL
jgi:splicing factor 3B subunit 1